MSKRLKSGDGMERRASTRYPLKGLRVSYGLAGREQNLAWGKTINISAGGVLFTVEERIPEGSVIQMRIDWPLPLNGITPLCLVVLGQIVRSAPNEAAVSIKRYELTPRSSERKQ